MDPFLSSALAIFIALSAVVRMGWTADAWRAVEERRATAEHLTQITALPRDQLHEVFGPSSMGGVWQSSPEEVRAKRGLKGVLISDGRLDGFCLLIAIAALFTSWSALEMTLLLAAAYQITGWTAALTAARG